MRSTILATLALAAFLSFSATADAEDRVVLKTGAVLEGKILRKTEKKVTIDIPGLGVVDVPRDQIERVEEGSAPPPPPDSEPDPEPGPDPDPALPPDQEDPTPAEGPTEATPTADSVSIPFGGLTVGQRALFILNSSGEETGRRMVAQVAVAGPKRAKIVYDPEAGVLGYAWVRREDVKRIIRLEGHPERLILFFDGMEIGAWVEGRAAKHGAFAGQLTNVVDEALTVLMPEDEGAVDLEISFADLRLLSGTKRSKEVEKALQTIEAGEPVALRIRGRKEPVRGRLLTKDSTYLTLEVADGPGLECREIRLFTGLPITNVTTLRESLRAAFVGLARGEHLTLKTVTRTEDSVVRRSITGTFAWVTLESVSLVSRDGLVDVPLASVMAVNKPDPDRVPLLMEGKEESDAENALQVLPGMTRAEVERRLPGGKDGIDVLYEEGRVKRVYCRAPFRGPVYGVTIGAEFAKAAKNTDLAFETQVDPKGGSTRLTTLLSQTLTDRAVKVYLGPAGHVMAVEVSAR